MLPRCGQSHLSSDGGYDINLETIQLGVIIVGRRRTTIYATSCRNLHESLPLPMRGPKLLLIRAELPAIPRQETVFLLLNHVPDRNIVRREFKIR